MNEVLIFNNPEFGSIRTAGTFDKPLFCLTDVAKALKYSNPAKAVIDHCKGVTILETPTNGGIQRMKYGDEGQMYRLILRANTAYSEKFQNWVTNDVIPSIRKHGGYLTPAAIEKALTDPDFIIGLATQLKTEKERVQLLADENKHKEEIIEGLVANISLADMRQRITQIIRKNGVANARGSYHLLYNEFNAKYHINVYTRMNNIVYKGNAMDYIEKELNMLPQLYDLTCKLFEDSYDSLMKSWGKTIQRATCERNLAKRKLLP